jgi:hypothetical protein
MNSKQTPVAIETGASSVIGLGLTLALMKQGHDLMGTSRSNSKSKELKASSEASAKQLQWLDRIFVVHALKVGLAGVLSLFVAQALRLQYPEWAPFTVMVLMMVHPHPGSIALKSLFRVVGTLVGASLGVWLVSDYLSSPIVFLSLTFLIMCVASYKELKAATARFCDAAKLVLAENPAVSMSSINSTLSALPMDIARTTTVLGVNSFLRQEQVKWNRLIPVLMCTGDQLSRLTSIRHKFMHSQELRLFLDSFHQDFGTWMDALGGFFRRPDSNQTLPSVQGLIDRLSQRMEGLMATDPLHPPSNSSAPEALIDVHEYLVTAQLMRLCGDMASSLRLVEYAGDYFL